MNKYGLPIILARFLRKDWLKDENTRVHFKAFMPPEKLSSNRIEISCFEVQRLQKSEVFEIASDHNINLNSKPPLGYAVVNERFPFKKLELDHNDTPLRHVDIIGWEAYPNKEDKMELAGRLADSSIIELRN